MRPLEILVVDAPLPERRVRQTEADLILDLLNVGDAIEFNRGRKAVENYCYRYRCRAGRELRFIVREVEPGRCRVWRVA